MDRAPVIVIAVVVAAMVLFGLRFFGSDDPASEVAVAGRRVGDVASAPRVGLNADDGQGSGGGAGGSARPLGARPRINSPGGGSGGAGGVVRGGEPSRSGSDSSNRPVGSGSARVLGGAARPGGSVGVSGAARPSAAAAAP